MYSYYSAGEEKSPYFLFHGETALRKILKFQGETPNFSEKFQGEIAEFLKESELLLVTHSNDNHSPGPVMREVSP